MLVTLLVIFADVMVSLSEYHGLLSEYDQSFILPVPEMVRTPFVKSHVRFSPQVPLLANIVPTLATSAKHKVKIFVFIVVNS